MTTSLRLEADITNSPFWLASCVSRYLTVLQRVQIRDGRSVPFVCVWTRNFGVIFHFARSSRGTPLVRLFYPRRQFAVIVFASKPEFVAFQQSPYMVMPRLRAVFCLPASWSATGTRLVPRYAAYFQFHTDGSEQYDIINIHSAMEICLVKKGS